jgi:transcription initiation factor IIE alpha subunit
MKYSRFLTTLLLGVSMTLFAAAQTHIHEHTKMQMKSDTSIVKDAHQKMVKEKYTCPMHPEVISDKPGKCPKCGMTLVKVKSSPVIKKSHKMQKDSSMSHPNRMH